VGSGAGQDLIHRSAAQLAGMVHRGEVSPREVVHAHLERIDRVNGELNAIVTLRPEDALTDARDVERMAREGRSLPLAGVPFTVKDLIATAGVRTTAGTRFLMDLVPAVDATAVGRLRAAGAILLGKTNCPEWGMFPYTRNELFGETRNPVGPVTVGGSSGGEASAVAANMSALGVGTDFGGSVRWPAHCTGLLALRPTAGLVPGTGQLPTTSLDEPLIPNAVTLQGRAQMVGLLARSVDDLEVALQVMAGPDGWDPFAAFAPPIDASAPAGAAVWDGPSWPAAREDVRAVVRNAARALTGRGLPVSDDRPDMLEAAGPLYSELRATDRLQDVRRLIRGHEDLVGDDVRAAVASAQEFERSTPVDPAPLWERRGRLRVEFGRFLDRHGVLVMPVATLPPYALDGPTPPVEGREQSMWDVLDPCRLISLVGFPAASVPFGASDDGLPIAVQVVGRPFREDQVLAVARMLMEERGAPPWERPRSEVTG
jgi:Asp-tRNA(Asn)/Glu-tRNA(Gln) amidotransferase A subunit family amidase